jgi:hypothetical protein
MAEKTAGLMLATDPSKINPAGASQEDLSEYQRSLDAQIKALEQRYANPNYFKVAAGFLKPQLGGFFASLGSASEALGENVEQQRAAELPIAQMRSQLAQSKILTGQNQTVADMVAEHLASGNPLTPEFVAKVKRIAPDAPSTKALMAQLETMQKQQQITSSQQQVELTRLMEMRKEGLIGPDEYQRRLKMLEVSAPGIAKNTNAPIEAIPLAGTPPTSGGAEPSATSATAPTPSAQPATPAQPTPAKPAEASGDFANFKITPSFSVSQLNPRAVTEMEKTENARLMEGAKLLEAVKEKQFQNLQIVNEPTAYATALEANKSTLDMLKESPEMAVKTTNMLRQAGSLVALLERGIGVSIGPYGANINVAGARPALYASLSPEEQKFQDKLLNNIARSVYYDLKSRGIDPEKEGAEKFVQRMSQETNIEQGPAAIHRAVTQNDIRLKHNKALYEATNKYYPKAKSVSLSPLHDLYTQHPEFKVLDIMLNKKLQATQ